MRGRYSHVAAAMEGRVLLVAGGYSGVARGDLVAYKVPLFISSDQGDRVSERKVETKQGNDVFRMTGRLTCEEANGRDGDEVVCVCVFVFCFTRMLFVLRLLMKACVLRTQSAVGVKAAVENISPLIR